MILALTCSNCGYQTNYDTGGAPVDRWACPQCGEVNDAALPQAADGQTADPTQAAVEADPDVTPGATT
jgi:rubredoxin